MRYIRRNAKLAAVALVGLVLLPAWREIADSEEWMHDFTVLTMTFDGAWGTATDPHINRAIAQAISNCKATSGAQLGCGAYMTSIRAGWSLGIRCGRENIIAAARTLAEAELIAARRELDLRTNYVADMPPCRRVVTVDPSGRVVAPPVTQRLAPRPTSDQRLLIKKSGPHFRSGRIP
jgi:hypothetical protein